MANEQTDQLAVSQLVRIAEGLGWQLQTDDRSGLRVTLTVWRLKTGVEVEPLSNLP